MSDEVTAERIRELFNYDPATGWLTHSTSTGRKTAGARPGTLNPLGYRQIGISGKIYLEHRLIWLHYYGRWPTADIDHINGVRDDNRISNLRDVSRRLNMQNQKRAHKRSESGLIGASRAARDRNLSRPWSAFIVVDGKRKRLGSFSTAEEAHACYLEAKRELHPGNTL